MPESIIDSILNGKITHEVLVKWLNDETIEDSPEYGALLCCSRNEFVAYFLSFLRNQTDSVLQWNRNARSLLQHQGTPEKILSSRRKHQRSVSEPTSELEGDRTTDSLSKADRNRSHESPNRDRKKPGRRVKTKLFNDSKDSFISSKTDSDDSRLSSGLESVVISSTPLKNGISVEYPNLPSPVAAQSRSSGHYERCDTPRVSHKHSKSQEKSSFGDYLANAQVKSSKKKRVTPKNVSKEAEDGKILDLSSSDMFPEIGARKSSSLRSEKRRIKPTNIDMSTPQKSFSLNSFISESFQQPSPLVFENSAFKQQNIQPKELANSFEAERNILKQERHKLMEKFNILNSCSPQKSPITPQIKITRKESLEKTQNFITADVSKVVFREKIDCLIETYEVLLKENLILSVSSEIYYLISILLSRQCEEECSSLELKLTEDTASEYILKSLHNSTYFAAKSLWHQRHILEFMLDKSSLKTLGENKKVRSFCPDLAKFLLNLYGIKTETEVVKDKVVESRSVNGVICFNFETDNSDNFPSLLSFQNFKKQRDLFYEILRWYTDSHHTTATKTSFRSRVKSLVSLAVSGANHAHLARLLQRHMLAECAQEEQQESKLSKLHRRLAGPASLDTWRLPRFRDNEMFYREFIMFAESESFRVHLRDSLATELCALEQSVIGGTEERDTSSNQDIKREYLQLQRKLNLLSKFLGFLTALPHTQVPTEYTIKTGSVNNYQQSKEPNLLVPKERVFENYIAMRNYSQPTIDLKSILEEANANSRLCITLPWMVQYLAMLDYTGLRTKYYQNLLKYIFQIYAQKLKINTENNMKKNTVIYLKLTLGWLFDLPHFPQESFYDSTLLKMATQESGGDEIDSLDLIDESILFDLCPYLKDVNALLVTSKPSSDVKEGGSFRHITPVSVSLNPEDRIRNKEKEIQSRLEAEFLKSQPSSTRRVLELVSERVTAYCLRRLAVCAQAARGDMQDSVDAANSNRHTLAKLRSTALEASPRLIEARVKQALSALLGGGGGGGGGTRQALTHVAIRACNAKLNKWIQDHWTSSDVLTKDIPTDAQTAQQLTDSAQREEDHHVESLTLPDEEFNRLNVSPNNVIIELKEQICLLLEYRHTNSEPTSLVSAAQGACRSRNVLARAPCRRALAALVADYVVVYVSRKPLEVTEEILTAVGAVWEECCPGRVRQVHTVRTDSPPPRDFTEDDRAPTPVSDEETLPHGPIKFIYPAPAPAPAPAPPTACKSAPISPIYPKPGLISPKILKGPSSPNLAVKAPSSPKSPIIKEPKEEVLDYFNRVLCARNIVLLSSSKCNQVDVWAAMARLLVFLLKSDFLSEDSLTEQCLAVYRQDWPQATLEHLSQCIRAVCSHVTSAGKLSLFLHFLAEYCYHMD